MSTTTEWDHDVGDITHSFEAAQDHIEMATRAFAHDARQHSASAAWHIAHAIAQMRES